MIQVNDTQAAFMLLASSRPKGKDLPYFADSFITEYSKAGAAAFQPYIYKVEKYLQTCSQDDILKGQIFSHFYDSSFGQYENVLYSALLFAAGSGWLSIVKEIPELKDILADQPDIRASFTPERAIEQLTSKLPIPKEMFELLSGQMKARAFTIARWNRIDLLDKVRDSLGVALKEGMPFNKWKKSIRDTLDKSGWVPANASHLNLVYETNMLQAYGAQRYKGMKLAAELRPYWQRKEVMDSRTRESHKKLHNLIYHHTHEFWKTHYAPDDYRCRGWQISLSARQVKAKGLKIQEEIPEFIKGQGFQGNPALGPAKLNRSEVDYHILQQAKSWEKLGYPAKLNQLKKGELLPSLDTLMERYDGSLEQCVAFYWREFKKVFGLKNKNDVAQFLDPKNNVVEVNYRSFNHLVTGKDEKTLSEARVAGNCRFIPLLKEALLDPEEMWLSKIVDTTGKEKWRRYHLSVFDLEKVRNIAIVVEATKEDYGLMWTILQSTKPKRFNNTIRQTVSVYRKEVADGSK